MAEKWDDNNNNLEDFKYSVNIFCWLFAGHTKITWRWFDTSTSRHVQLQLGCHSFFHVNRPERLILTDDERLELEIDRLIETQLIQLCWFDCRYKDLPSLLDDEWWKVSRGNVYLRRAPEYRGDWTPTRSRCLRRPCDNWRRWNPPANWFQTPFRRKKREKHGGIA